MIEQIAFGLLGGFAVTQTIINWKLRREIDGLWGLVNTIISERGKVTWNTKPYRKD